MIVISGQRKSELRSQESEKQRSAQHTDFLLEWYYIISLDRCNVYKFVIMDLFLSSSYFG